MLRRVLVVPAYPRAGPILRLFGDLLRVHDLPLFGVDGATGGGPGVPLSWRRTLSETTFLQLGRPERGRPGGPGGRSTTFVARRAASRMSWRRRAGRRRARAGARARRLSRRYFGIVVSWCRGPRRSRPSPDEPSRSALLDMEHSFSSQIVA